jgi:hypothetical protein
MYPTVRSPSAIICNGDHCAFGLSLEIISLLRVLACGSVELLALLRNAGFVSISFVTQVHFYNKINVEEKYISIIRQGDLISNLQHNILKFGLNHTQICPTTSAKHGLHGCEWFFIKHVKHDTPKWYVCNVGWTETAMAGGEHGESACGGSAVSSKSVECVHRGRSLRS